MDVVVDFELEWAITGHFGHTYLLWLQGENEAFLVELWQLDFGQAFWKSAGSSSTLETNFAFLIWQEDRVRLIGHTWSTFTIIILAIANAINVAQLRPSMQ